MMSYHLYRDTLCILSPVLLEQQVSLDNSEEHSPLPFFLFALYTQVPLVAILRQYSYSHGS